MTTLHDDDHYPAGSDCPSCCESEQSCLHKGTCELDITSEESLSFSLQDASSLCDDYGEQLAMSPAPSAGTGDVGSTGFEDFLLCFDEKQQRALQSRSESSSYIISQQQYIQHMRSAKAQALRKHSKGQTSTAVSMPRFLWQPDGGLCCRSDEHANFKGDEEFILSEEHSEEDDDDDTEISLLNDNAPLVPSRSRRSSFDGSSILDLDGGTLEDPRYVPRPSSTSPGLRNMSQFFRTLSSHEEDTLELESGWDNDGDTARGSQASEQTDTPPPHEAHQEGAREKHVQSSAAASEESLTSSATELIHTAKNPQSTSTTPPLNRFLHRRSRSEIKTPSVSSQTASISLSSSVSLQRSRTEEGPRHHRRNFSGELGKKGKNSLMSFLCKTRFSSFRKLSISEDKNTDKDNQEAKEEKPTETGEAAADDVANILASLEDTLKQQERDHAAVSKPSNVPVLSPTQKCQIHPLSTEGSGETLSDTSSLFGGIDSEDDTQSTCSDDDSQNADRFFATPYYANQYRWRKETAALRQHKTLFGQLHLHYSSLEEKSRFQESCLTDTTSMMSSRTELTRCSSVDTAKASNLSCDPGADRARLLEIQAYLVQQQKEREKRLNAPPIEYEAPDGDNVIRVREANCETIDAACEIEVLPKQHAVPATAAEF